MNTGLDIFKRAQHLQEGVNNLGYDPSGIKDPPSTGFGSGKPTQKAIGFIGNFLGNMVFPGLGFLTGAAASKITQMIQNGASQQAVQKAVQAYQTGGGGGGETSTEVGGLENVTGAATQQEKKPSAGVGIDPWGNPADPGEWWDPSFGRWTTDKTGDFPGSYNLAGPGGAFGTRGLGSSGFGGTVGNFGTAIGWEQLGRGGGPVGAERYRSGAGLYRPFTAAQYAGLGGHGYASPAFGAPTQRPSYEQYLSMWHPTRIGGGSAQGSRHMGQRLTAQKGTSNVGLGIFKRLQQGTEDAKPVQFSPEDLLERYLAAMELAERHRAEAMNETSGYGNSPDVIYPEELAEKHKTEQLIAQRALERAMGQQQYAHGTSNVNQGLYFYRKQLKRKKHI